MSLFPLPVHYARAERKGSVELGCRAIECFRPFHFGRVGYPFSINSITELWKYTECMHDGIGFPQPLDDYLISNVLQGGFTHEEFEHIKVIVAAVNDLGKAIGRPCQVPTVSLYLALNHARHIRAVAQPGSLVVELGGGAGYLGALLVLMGYRYVGSDISQAFYLLQSHLLSRVAPLGRLDLIDDQIGVADLRALKPHQGALVPWWRWVRREIPGALAVDVITSNHNILEMHSWSLLYHLSVLRDALTENAAGLVFEGWGDPSQHPTWQGVMALANKGFVMAHNDRRITCFTPGDSPHAREGVLRYPLPLPAPDMPAVPVAPAVPPAAGVRGLRDRVRRRARRFLLDPMPPPAVNAPAINPNEYHYAAPEFSDARNPWSRSISAMRAKEAAEVAHSVADYKTFLGRSDLATVDQGFLAYLFRGTPLAHPWADAAQDK